MCAFLAVHAGIGKHAHKTEDLCREAIRRANGDIVEAIKVLEDDPRTNCGFGSNLTLEGNVECEAAFASSEGHVFGAVGAVSRIRNPIEVAAMIAKEQLGRNEKQFVPPAILVGKGAECWAQQHGIELCDPSSMISNNSRQQWQKAQKIADSWKNETMDTVGAVSYGSNGCCNAACSSGGIILKTEGRLGHTTQIGGAIWADQKDSKSIAIALSGCGEYIAQTLFARKLADGLLSQSTEDYFMIDKIKSIFDVTFLNSPYLWNRNKKHILAGGLVLFIDREYEYAELMSFHNADEMTFAYGRNEAAMKYRSFSASNEFVAHSFSLSDYISF